MCGITGIWTNRVDPRIAQGKVTAMTERVGHRGPDDFGITCVSGSEAGNRNEPVVVFGHRRLSIIDLTSAGHQPMRDEETGNWITFNGEIYNYRELRAELESKGHRFRSQSDTEVILKAYAEWDLGCWRRLRGIFAFGLWNARQRELHMVRDHLGVKPLYWARTERGVAFASEVRAILAAEWVPSRLSRNGLASYLKYGSVQEPVTMIEGIESLPPGHWAVCRADGEIGIHHFWRTAECMLRNWSNPPTGAELFGHLKDTVQRQLVADVPVGVFLSGGIDSTAIAALAANIQPGGIRTFCIGSDEKDFDESAEAESTARHLGCVHQTLVLEGRMVRDEFSRALASYDQPSADGLNTYFISKLVRSAGIKVALSGLGGDELFVGYGGFRKGLTMEKLGRASERMPVMVRDYLSTLLANITSPGSAVSGGLGELLERDLPAPYFASRTHFSRRHSRLLVQSVPQSGDGQPNLWAQREGKLAKLALQMAPVDRVAFFELQTYMLSTLLRDADQMSMAHGLELRVPLVDPEIIEHVQPISPSEKTAGGVSKRLLLDTLHGLIPSEVMRRRKRGFTLPFQYWFKRDLQNTVSECFNSTTLQGPWETRTFRQTLADFNAGKIAWSRILALFTAETWLKENRVTV